MRRKPQKASVSGQAVKLSSWPPAKNSGVRGRAPARKVNRKRGRPPFCFVRSLRDLFRPTSHLFAVQQQELLRHGFRNHKDSPPCGLDRHYALTRSRTKTSRRSRLRLAIRLLFLQNPPGRFGQMRLIFRCGLTCAALPLNSPLPPRPNADNDWNAARGVRERRIHHWRAPPAPNPHNWLSVQPKQNGHKKKGRLSPPLFVAN